MSGPLIRDSEPVIPASGREQTFTLMKVDMDVLNRVMAERDRYRAALAILADAENWSDNPEAHGAILYGHFTPYELAREALEGPADA